MGIASAARVGSQCLGFVDPVQVPRQSVRLRGVEEIVPDGCVEGRHGLAQRLLQVVCELFSIVGIEAEACRPLAESAFLFRCAFDCRPFSAQRGHFRDVDSVEPVDNGADGFGHAVFGVGDVDLGLSLSNKAERGMSRRPAVRHPAGDDSLFVPEERQIRQRVPFLRGQ